MKTNYPKISLYLTLFALFTSNLVIAQQQDHEGHNHETESSNTYDEYERIKLDNTIAYRNINTGEIITSSAYANLQEADLDQEDMASEEEYDHWVCEKVNPYKDVVLPNPFLVRFDQTTYTPPVDGKMLITSRYGKRKRGPHRGIDIDLVTGDVVRSMLPGKVRFVGYSKGHGNTVVVRHANEVETVYAHLSAYHVKVNDEVSEGQILGKGGATGNARGSHLHLEVRYKGVCIHPEYIFDFDGNNTIKGQELWVTNTWKSPNVHSSYRKSTITPLTSESEAIAYQANEPKFYKVKKGDTLSKVARSYNLYLSEICNLNALSTSTTLRIGQMLRIR